MFLGFISGQVWKGGGVGLGAVIKDFWYIDSPILNNDIIQQGGVNNLYMVSNFTISPNHWAFYGHFFSNLRSFSNHTICTNLVNVRMS